MRWPSGLDSAQGREPDLRHRGFLSLRPGPQGSCRLPLKRLDNAAADKGHAVAWSSLFGIVISAVTQRCAVPDATYCIQNAEMIIGLVAQRKSQYFLSAFEVGSSSPR